MFLSEWREYPSDPCLAGKKSIIKLIIYVSTTFLFVHKATCFDLSVDHLQAYITDYVIGAVFTLGSQYVYISTHIWIPMCAQYQ